jgi:hypothetical protein
LLLFARPPRPPRQRNRLPSAWHASATHDLGSRRQAGLAGEIAEPVRRELRPVAEDASRGLGADRSLPSRTREPRSALPATVAAPLSLGTADFTRREAPSSGKVRTDPGKGDERVALSASPDFGVRRGDEATLGDLHEDVEREGSALGLSSAQPSTSRTSTASRSSNSSDSYPPWASCRQK